MGLAILLGAALALPAQEPDDPRVAKSDWGSDCVGKPLPNYRTGDECLFGHRTDVGSRWQTERHNASMRAKQAVRHTRPDGYARYSGYKFHGEVCQYEPRCTGRPARCSKNI